MGKKSNDSIINRGPSGILTIAAFLLMASPVLFLEWEPAVAVCSLAGYFVFLLAERASRNKKQFLFTWLAFLLAFTLRFCTFFGTDSIYIAKSAGAALASALVNSLVLVLDHLLVRKGHRILSILAVPAVYALVQYFHLVIDVGNYLDPLGYTMVLPVYSMNLSQIGEYGLNYATALAMSLMADSISRNRKNRNIAGLVLGLGLAGVLVVTGDIMYNAAKEPDTVLHVALGLPFEADFEGLTGYDQTEEEWRELIRKTVETAAQNGADLLVLSEEFIPMWASEEEEVKTFVSDTVKEYGVPALICYEIEGEGEVLSFNEAVFYDGQGNVCMSYEKNNLVPFIEAGDYVEGNETAGTCTVELVGQEIRTATLICFDLNDAELVHKVPAETELLLVPAWEWDMTNVEQRRLRNRSVELGTTVLKHAMDGFAYVSGPWGQAGEMIDNRGVYETVRIIDVPIWKK